MAESDPNLPCVVAKLISENDPTLSCVALKVLRAICRFDQGQLAHALKMNPRKLSAIERGRTVKPPFREFLVRSAQAMHAPESLIDEIYAFLRKVARAQPSRPVGLHRMLEAIARSETARFGGVLLETTIESSGEGLAATERAIGESLWGFFTAHPESRRNQVVRTEAMFHRWAFVERLWQESLTAAADDQERALALAELARIAAEETANDPVLRKRTEGLSENDPNLSCVVLKVMRAICRCDQGQLAHALRMRPKKLSAIERATTENPPTPELLARAAQALQLPESVIDEIYTFLRRFARARLPGSLELQRELEAITQRAEARFEGVFLETTSESSRDALAATERAIGKSLWSFLIALPEPQRNQAVRTETLFHRWGFVERLWNESLTAAADDHRRALALAELARVAAEGITSDPDLRSRTEGLAWSGIANAKRVGGELPAADQDFARAKGLWGAGASADPGILDEARFFAIEVALRRAQRSFPEALACLAQVLAKAKPGTEAEFLVWKGNILFELQRQDEAAPLYLEAIARRGPDTSLRLLWVARFNFVACLCDLARPQEARDMLPELRATATEMGNGLDLLRVRWLEGRVEAAFGKFAEAIEILGEARDGFLARDILFDAAIAGLERAALQLEMGRTAEVKAEAPELADTFKKLGVAPELLASLTLFCAAAQAEMATAEEARHMLALLRQASGNPNGVP